MSDETRESTVSRREMLGLAAAALAAPALKAGVLQHSTVYAPRFFTAAEYALVDELTDLIIPTDDHSPGARAAQVAAFIDARLAESFEPEPKQTWRTGLAAIEALSHDMHGKPFLRATAEQRVALLTKIAAAEKQPETSAERSFGQLKGATIHGYYTSKIGIHTDQEYKGNVYQTGDYAGFDAT